MLCNSRDILMGFCATSSERCALKQGAVGSAQPGLSKKMDGNCSKFKVDHSSRAEEDCGCRPVKILTEVWQVLKAAKSLQCSPCVSKCKTLIPYHKTYLLKLHRENEHTDNDSSACSFFLFAVVVKTVSDISNDVCQVIQLLTEIYDSELSLGEWLEVITLLAWTAPFISINSSS